MTPTHLAPLASLGYAALAAWALLLAWRDRRRAEGLRWPWLTLGLAASLSAVWAWWSISVEVDAFERLEPELLLLDGARQLAWMAWFFTVLGLGRSTVTFWAPLRWILALGVPVAGLIYAAAALRWIDREAQAAAPWYAGLGLAVLGLVLLEQLYRNVVEDHRWNVKPLCLGLATMYGFDLYLFAQAVLLQQHDVQASALRPVVHALGLPLMLVGTFRGQGLTGRFGLSRDAAFHSVALLLAGGYLMLAAAIGYWLRFTGGEWGIALQLLLLVAAVLLLGMILMSGAMRARLRVWLSKHFLRYRYDYRQEWLRFTAALADPATAGDPGGAVLRALAPLVESRGGGLWRSDGHAHVQVAQWNFDRRGSSEPLESAFVQALASRPWIIDLESERREANTGSSVPKWLLDDREAWLVIPLLAGGQLQGWVVLLQPRTAFPLNWEVLDLLRTAASQAAGFLAMLQASDQLMEARKFEAFNRMSAFVVHDLKNIVTQLSLMVRNAERHGDNPEFRRDMMETVDNALDKMRQLMTQLREGHRPSGLTSGVSLQPIAQRLQVAAAQRGRRLELEIAEPLATRGHEERVERVIGHAVQNAFDASQEHQTVQLSLDRFGSYARLAVRDSGCGMSAEFIRERLFKPFQTTKAQGMGIGAYESLQYVQELGGKMDVQSEPGQGSCVTFLLPLFHSHQPDPTPAPSESP